MAYDVSQTALIAINGNRVDTVSHQGTTVTRIFDSASVGPSPALQPRTDGRLAAYEIKFALDQDLAAEVEAYYVPLLMRDPHGDGGAGHAYHVTTLYTDTPRYDVFHRVGSHKYRKFRLRRYGSDEQTYLERKVKRGNRVRKQRSMIAGCELPWLAGGDAPHGWAGHWYRTHLRYRNLWPVCRISYWRSAFMGWAEAGPVRLTFDRHIRAARVTDWSFYPRASDTPILPTHVICEFKFHGALPSVFKAAVLRFQLVPIRNSKYRLGAQAIGSVQNGGKAHA